MYFSCSFRRVLRMALGVCSLVVLFSLLLSSCATISGQKEYTVWLKSEPEKANVSISDERGKVVFTGQTPTYANLPTSNGYFQGKNYTATFTKEGLMPYSAYLQHEVSGLYVVGNGLFGGILGWLVADPVSGGMWRLPTDVQAKLGTERVDTAITPTYTKSWGRFSLGGNVAFGSESIAAQLGASGNTMLYYEVLPRFAIGFGIETMSFQNLIRTTVGNPGFNVQPTSFPNLSYFLAGSFMYRFQDSPLATPYISVTGGGGVGLTAFFPLSWMYSGMFGYQWMLGNYSVFVEGGYTGVHGEFFSPLTIPIGITPRFQSGFLQTRFGVNFYF